MTTRGQGSHRGRAARQRSTAARRAALQLPPAPCPVARRPLRLVPPSGSAALGRRPGRRGHESAGRGLQRLSARERERRASSRSAWGGRARATTSMCTTIPFHSYLAAVRSPRGSLRVLGAPNMEYSSMLCSWAASDSHRGGRTSPPIQDSIMSAVGVANGASTGHGRRRVGCNVRHVDVGKRREHLLNMSSHSHATQRVPR